MNARGQAAPIQDLTQRLAEASTDAAWFAALLELCNRSAKLPSGAACIAGIRLERGVTPEDVANLCLFPASDLAGYITGQVLRIDGGLLMWLSAEKKWGMRSASPLRFVSVRRTVAY